MKQQKRKSKPKPDSELNQDLSFDFNLTEIRIKHGTEFIFLNNRAFCRSNIQN